MTDRPQSDTLAAALPREMVRVAFLIPVYRAVQNGGLAAALMKASIDRAQEAIDAWDAGAIAAALADLRGYTL